MNFYELINVCICMFVCLFVCLFVYLFHVGTYLHIRMLLYTFTKYSIFKLRHYFVTSIHYFAWQFTYHHTSYSNLIDTPLFN